MFEFYPEEPADYSAPGVTHLLIFGLFQGVLRAVWLRSRWSHLNT